MEVWSSGLLDSQMDQLVVGQSRWDTQDCVGRGQSASVVNLWHGQRTVIRQTPVDCSGRTHEEKMTYKGLKGPSNDSPTSTNLSRQQRRTFRGFEQVPSVWLDLLLRKDNLYVTAKNNKKCVLTLQISVLLLCRREENGQKHSKDWYWCHALCQFFPQRYRAGTVAVETDHFRSKC